MTGEELRKIRKGWGATLADVAQAGGVAVMIVSSCCVRSAEKASEIAEGKHPPD